jgi:hypothetical protein
MQTIKIENLEVSRAGSDFLGHSWSMHAKGFDFKKGERYLLERKDGSTFEVGATSRSPRMGWHLVEADGLGLLGY